MSIRQTRLSSRRCTARLRIIFQCSHCPLSTTKPLPERPEPPTRATWTLRVRPYQHARLFPQEAVPRGRPHGPITTPAVHPVPRPKKRQGCASMAPHLMHMLNGDGTAAVGRVARCARAGRQASPRPRLARLEQLPRQLQVRGGFHVKRGGRDTGRGLFERYLRAPRSCCEAALDLVARLRS